MAPYISTISQLSYIILGGAIGNAIDRMLTLFPTKTNYNGVIDFIDIGFGNFRWYIFNVADMSITIGHDISGKGANTAFIAGTSGAYNGANSSSWSTTSDRRIKKNIVNNDSGLDKLKQIQVRQLVLLVP